MPVFVELQPSEHVAAIEAALGPSYAKQLLSCSGVLRGPRQSLQSLAREASRRYVKQLVERVPDGPVSIAITAFREPTEQHDLTLDWRSLFDPYTRVLAPGTLETIREALADIRDALQSRERSPEVTVEISLPMPLAMLVGYEWRSTTQLRVTVETVNPGLGDILAVAPGGERSDLVSASRAATGDGAGPFVLALSVGATLGATVDRYAAEHAACGFEHLHVDRDPTTDPLDAGDIRGLAAVMAKRLNELQAAGAPKHLLLRAPASLAAAIGLGANGTGATRVPFYDGHDYYVSGITIG